METFLVTRPKMQNEQICEFLQSHGCKAIAEPLCDVEFLKYEEDDVAQLKSGEVQAVFITSYNASKTFLEFNFSKSTPIYAIGKRCVRDIEKAGYKNIKLPDFPSVKELEKIFLQENPGQLGKVFYFCGNLITRDLSLTLEQYKFDIIDITAYLVKYHEKFSQGFLDIFDGEDVDSVLCYSKNNARCIAKCADESDLRSKLDKLNFYAISEEVAAELKKQGFSNVFTFEDHELLKKYYNLL